MVAGMMILLFGLMFFGLAVTVYSAVSKLKRKGQQGRWLHRKPGPTEPDGKRRMPGYLREVHFEKS